MVLSKGQRGASNAATPHPAYAFQDATIGCKGSAEPSMLRRSPKEARPCKRRCKRAARSLKCCDCAVSILELQGQREAFNIAIALLRYDAIKQVLGVPQSM